MKKKQTKFYAKTFRSKTVSGDKYEELLLVIFVSRESPSRTSPAKKQRDHPYNLSAFLNSSGSLSSEFSNLFCIFGILIFWELFSFIWGFEGKEGASGHEESKNKTLKLVENFLLPTLEAKHEILEQNDGNRKK